MAAASALRAAARPQTAPVARSTAAALLGAVLIVGAAAVMAGWIGRIGAIVLSVQGGIMVFNTALCFALLGVAAVSARALSPTVNSALHPLLGAAVASMAAVALLQHFTAWDLDIDWPELHRWAVEGEPHPGRMSRLTALTMLLAGASLALMHWVARVWVGLLVQALTGLVIAMGLVGLAGWALRLHLVYENYVFGRTSFAAAAGFIAAGVALWLTWRRMDWYRLRSLIVDEGLRISLNAIVLLAIMLTLTLIAGFAIFEHQLDASSRKHLVDPLKRRIDHFRLVVDLRSVRAGMVATGVTPSAMLRALSDKNVDEAARTQFRSAAEASLQHGFSGIALLDSAGRVRLEVGRLIATPEAEFKLADRDASLLWDEGLVLRTRQPLRQGDQRVGMLLAEQRLHQLTTLLEYALDFASTGDVIVCARGREGLRCLPHRNAARSYVLPGDTTLPIAKTFAGETGVRLLRDRSGANVVAAYGPVGNLGLGMAITMRTSEIYAPLRGKLLVVAVLLAGMIAVGAALVHWRVAPLARRHILQEQRLKLALDNSKSAVWDLDLRTGTVYLSEQWPTLLGQPAGADSTSLEELYRLVHPEDVAQVQRKLRAALKSEDLPYDIDHRVRAPDGQWIWIHSVGKVVQRDSHGRALRMIGVNTNIARRKQEQSFVERRASRDDASGLPNRSVFGDRLHMAMARSRRAPPDRSLMAVLVVGIDGAGELPFADGDGRTLLREAVDRMQRAVRATDSVARLGVDEFAIILEELGLTDQALGIGDKVIDALRERIAIPDGSVTLSASVGIAFYDGVIKVTGEQLVADAQHAMADVRNDAPNTCRVAAHAA